MATYTHINEPTKTVDFLNDSVIQSNKTFDLGKVSGMAETTAFDKYGKKLSVGDVVKTSVTTYTVCKIVAYNKANLVDSTCQSNYSYMNTSTLEKVLNPGQNTTKDEEEMSNSKTLYEIKSGELTFYGFKLAVNSQGQWVMEVKGSGEVIAVDKTKVTEVMPYTVDINFCDGGQRYSYFDEKRQVSKGDVVVISGSNNYVIAVVEGVDTKSKAATKELVFFKKLA